ncbi:MAG: exodeoxyribonuclease III [Planctomycetota bacterium]
MHTEKMRIVTWNVNSVRARLPRLLEWLGTHRPDVVCLQETKVIDESFPREYIEDAGYDVVMHGQKSYNGVAILAKHRLEDVVKGFPDDPPEAQARAIAATVGGFRILNLYVPNGDTVGHEKYHYKLAWLERLRSYLQSSFDPADSLIVCGDFNITFDDRDVHDPDAWRDKILCSVPERELLESLIEFGLTDALRRFHEEGGIYTWWDQRRRAYSRDDGLRIDHVLLGTAAMSQCTAVEVDRAAAGGPGASDHAPVTADFDA